MLNVETVPCGTPSATVISGAGLWVGPRMKLPSSVAGALAPSGNSLAVTYPGLCGSRVGGTGRAGRTGAGGTGACVWAAPERVIKEARRRRNISFHRSYLGFRLLDISS